VDRSAPQKHVWRANIILARAEGCGTAKIIRRSGKSKQVVWTWQARFMAEGVAWFVRTKTRKPGKESLLPDTVKRVIDLAPAPPPGATTHWTGRMLARRRVSARVQCNASSKPTNSRRTAFVRSSCRRIRSSHSSAERTLASTFVPPAYAIVLSADEKIWLSR
jgi:hypothetical protein